MWRQAYRGRSPVMSQATQPEQEEQTLKKDVTLVAYADDEHARSEDEFVTGVTGVDTSERETVSSRDVTIEIDLGKSYPSRRHIPSYDFSDEGLDAFKRSLANSKMKEYIDVEDKRTTSSKRVTSISNAVDEWIGELWSQLPEELDGLIRDEHTGVWKDDQDVAHIRVKKPTVEEMRVLSKESERESDDLYETMSERHCMKFQIIIEGDNEEQLDHRTEAIVPVLHKWLPKQTGIGKVRYMSCTVTQQREGECYNI